MGQTVVLTGMVLTAMPVGDYDKRITILTRERGKIAAFARGARRPNSQMLAASNPFCFGEFELYEGKSAYSLVRTTIHNYFRELTEDLDSVYYGFYFLEFAEYYCQENNDEKEMLKLLYQSLRALQSPAYSARLVRAVFELKALAINGEGPEMFSCIRCHGSEGLRVFSVNRGGIFCETCGKDITGTRLLDSTRYTFQFIISSSIEKLYSFQVSEEVLIQMEGILKEYMDYYLHHKFKSLQILEIVT